MAHLVRIFLGITLISSQWLVIQPAMAVSVFDQQDTEFAQNLTLIQERSPSLTELLRHSNLQNGRANKFLADNKVIQVANMASYFKSSEGVEKEFKLIIDKISADFLKNEKDEQVIYDDDDPMVRRADLVLLALAKSNAKEISASHLMSLRVILGLDTEEELKRAEQELSGMEQPIADAGSKNEGEDSDSVVKNDKGIIIVTDDKGGSFTIEGGDESESQKARLDALQEGAFANVETGLKKLEQVIDQPNPILVLIESELSQLSVSSLKLKTRLLAYAIMDFAASSSANAGENSFNYIISLVGQEKADAIAKAVVGLKDKGMDLVDEMKKDPVFAGKMAFNIAGLALSVHARSIFGITWGVWSLGKVIIERVPTSKLVFQAGVILNKARNRVLENDTIRDGYLRAEAEISDLKILEEETVNQIKKIVAEKAIELKDCAAQLTKGMGSRFKGLKGRFDSWSRK